MKQQFSELRKMMVNTQLLTDGVTDYSILQSMGSVPREYFVPKSHQALAYSDMDHEISSTGRYLISPVAFGRLLQLAKIKPTDIVLVVGSNIGYSVAVIANLASAVVGVEQDEKLIAKANMILTELDVGNGVVLQGDPKQGVALEAPFDVIIIEGAIDNVPSALFEQLRDGGRLIAVINHGATGDACIYIKSGENIAVRKMFNLKIPALPSFQKQAEFSL